MSDSDFLKNHFFSENGKNVIIWHHFIHGSQLSSQLFIVSLETLQNEKKSFFLPFSQSLKAIAKPAIDVNISSFLLFIDLRYLYLAQSI